MKLRVPNKNHQRRGGFSLLELIVAMSIFLLLTTAILARHSQFSRSILVENLAYDIALSIRRAQVFGLSVREFEVGSGKFDVGYGIHFFDSGNDNTYIFFADINRDGTYNSGLDGVVENITLGGNNIISDFCGTLSNGVEKCSSTGAISSLDIVFERPNPDALITVDEDAGTLYSSAMITVRSSQGTEWNINTVATGQISVQK